MLGRMHGFHFDVVFHLKSSPQSFPSQKKSKGLYSTRASPVVPHPSTRRAHGCLASEIGRDPAFPTRFDRTEMPFEVMNLGAKPDNLLGRPEIDV